MSGFINGRKGLRLLSGQEVKQQDLLKRLNKLKEDSLRRSEGGSFENFVKRREDLELFLPPEERKSRRKQRLESKDRSTVRKEDVEKIRLEALQDALDVFQEEQDLNITGSLLTGSPFKEAASPRLTRSQQGRRFELEQIMRQKKLLQQELEQLRRQEELYTDFPFLTDDLEFSSKDVQSRNRLTPAQRSQLERELKQLKSSIGF